MPSIIKKAMKQRAVYWAPVEGSPNQFNEKDFQRAVIVKCRWTEKTEEVLNAAGERVISNSQVMVDRDLVVGGYLMLLLGGSKPPKTMTDDQLLQTIPNQLNPLSDANNDSAWEIFKFDKTPTLKVNDFLRVAFL